MAKKKTNKWKYIENTLRAASRKWKPKNDAFVAARVSRGNYECAKCKAIVKRGELNVDHKEAVINPMTGFTTWDDYIERLLLEEDGYQVLCIPCHKEKTAFEDNYRGEMRRLKKEFKEKLKDYV